MFWLRDKNSFTYQAGQLAASFNLSQPQFGISLSSSVSAAEMRLFGVRFQEPDRFREQDCYVRQNDLMAVYPQTSKRPFNVHLQYKIVAKGVPDFSMPVVCEEDAHLASEPLVIELWVSNYTFLLDSYPQIDVTAFRVESDSAHQLQLWEEVDGQLSPIANTMADDSAIAAVTYGDDSGGPSFAILLHPMDQADTSFTLDRDDDAFATVVLRLLDRFMEKGVIRRWRARLIVTAERLDESQLSVAYLDFADSPLPLTT